MIRCWLVLVVLVILTVLVVLLVLVGLVPHVFLEVFGSSCVSGSSCRFCRSWSFCPNVFTFGRYISCTYLFIYLFSTLLLIKL